MSGLGQGIFNPFNFDPNEPDQIYLTALIIALLTGIIPTDVYEITLQIKEIILLN